MKYLRYLLQLFELLYRIIIINYNINYVKNISNNRLLGEYYEFDSLKCSYKYTL